MAFGHFLLGAHNFMAMALGSCAKWPLVARCDHVFEIFQGLLHIHHMFSKPLVTHATTSDHVAHVIHGYCLVAWKILHHPK